MFAKLVSVLQQSGPTIGVVSDDAISSKFVDEWNAAFAPKKTEFTESDVSLILARVLAVKDESELKCEHTAADMCTAVMQDFFIDEMAGVFEEMKPMTNKKMSDRIAGVLNNDKLSKKLFGSAPAIDMVDWSTSPIVMSGGRYDLSPDADSTTDMLHAGTVICTLSMRYFMYNATISRTFMIDPTPAQEKNYNLILDLHKEMLTWLKPGETLGSIYAKASDYIKERRPDLIDNLSPDCGFVTGIEVVDRSQVVGPGCSETLQANMVVSLRIGLEKMTNPKATESVAKNYSYQVIDTIQIKGDNGPASVLTKCSMECNDVSFFFNDEDEEGTVAGTKDGAANSQSKTAPKKNGTNAVAADSSSKTGAAAAARPPVTRRSAILPSKFRSEEKEEEFSSRKRREHQKELLNRLMIEGRRRYAGDAGNDGEETKVVKKFESYKRVAALPRETRSGKILVDERADTVILPVYGMAVPFHISTFKSITRNDEGEYVYLRLNMVCPGQGVNKKGALPTDDLESTFVRSLTFRSTDVVRMNEIFQSITALKRDQAKRETEKAQLANIVKQDKLVPMTGRRPFRLPEVFMRPVAEGKRIPSALEVHTNGLRYVSIGRNGGTTVDLLFNNIRHLFFQPCDNELIVLIHVHLWNPIMLGKKKTQDIQFYREASDATFDETGNRRRRIRYGDEDEIEAEQEERRRRRQLNKEFKEFAAKIAEGSNHEVEVDTPFREVSFSGVPARSNVLLQPTVDCLVHLSDTPFFVVTVADIEIVHLERIQFGLKNFDMVFVYKDFKRTPIHINTVPMKQVDNVKEWLDSVNLAFTEGPVNLNWTQIMKTVTKDPAGFYEDEGWKFLAADSDAEDESGEEEESEFTVSEDEFGASESESSGGESGFGTESDDSGGYSDEDEDMSGEDWDELERKAQAYDAKRQLPDAASPTGSKRSRRR